MGNRRREVASVPHIRAHIVVAGEVGGLFSGKGAVDDGGHLRTGQQARTIDPGRSRRSAGRCPRRGADRLPTSRSGNPKNRPPKRQMRSPAEASRPPEALLMSVSCSRCILLCFCRCWLLAAKCTGEKNPVPAGMDCDHVFSYRTLTHMQQLK